MAGTTTKSKRLELPGSAPNDLLIQFNKMVDDLETLRSNTDMINRNRCFAKAAAAIGTTTTKVKSVNSVDYAIDGEIKRKAGTDDLWTLSGAVVADGFVNKYLLCLDASGTASIVEGTQATTAGAVVLPALPASKSVIATLTVASAGATFTPGTTALNAGTVTATYRDGLDSGYFSAGASALTAAKVGDPTGTAISS